MKNIISAVIIVLSAVSGIAQDISYKLSMPEPHTHYFHVEMTVQDMKAKEMDFKMPVWAPGSYLVREFSKNVEDFSAMANDQELEVNKIRKNTWRVQTNKANKVTIKYKVYAYELSVRTSFMDASHAYLNGTSVFMFIDGHLRDPGTLEIEPFPKWKKISTGLKQAGNKWTYSFPNYDILVDSPIEIGNHETFEFKAAGVLHKVAMYGEGNYDKDKLKVDMAKIIEACTDVFGFNPNKEYTFIIHNLTKGSGGLEHLNSTTLQVNRWTYEGSAYKRFLSLVAHEYFHLWNVKRIRPKELGPFDYENEVYTRLLWIMEGFTSYYDELILLRAGYYSEQEYLSVLSRTITRVENQPGNKVLPLSQSSFDAWIKLYRPNENSYNTTISYYSKGSIVAAMLDLIIINATDGKKKLDDVLVVLYKKYYEEKNRGFTEAEAKAALEEVSGVDLDDFFAKYINGTETIDYEKFFGHVGLALVNTNLESDKPYLGAFTKEEDGKMVISTVVRNTSAYESGLNVDDEIIAVDGHRISKKLLDQLVDAHKVGDELEFLISRDGLIMTITVKLKPDPSVNYVLLEAAQVKPKDMKKREVWLNQME